MLKLKVETRNLFNKKIMKKNTSAELRKTIKNRRIKFQITKM